MNDGNLTITGINVIDPLTGDKWPVESLVPGATKEFETSYTVTAADAAAGEVLNVATAEGKSPDPKKPDVPVTPGEDPEPTIETKFTLIIRYWIGSKDGELIDTVNRVEKAGTAYDVATPPMEGYTADTERVKGVLDKDMEYDVVYTAEEYTLTILYKYTYDSGHQENLYRSDGRWAGKRPRRISASGRYSHCHYRYDPGYI